LQRKTGADFPAICAGEFHVTWTSFSIVGIAIGFANWRWQSKATRQQNGGAIFFRLSQTARLS
jgi:hypothetical protein